MTSIFDDIKRDREAGTGGKWVQVESLYDEGWSLDTDSENTVMGVGREGGRPIAAVAVESAWGKDFVVEANTRRIARVPQLEAIALAAERVDEDMHNLIELFRPCATDSVQVLALTLAAETLAKIREACK